MRVTLFGNLQFDRHPHLNDGALARDCSNRERGGSPVMRLQPPFDVSEADARAAASFKGIGRRAGAGILHDERKAPNVVAEAIDPAANHDLSPNVLLRNAMLDRVFHDGLE